MTVENILIFALRFSVTTIIVSLILWLALKLFRWWNKGE